MKMPFAKHAADEFMEALDGHPATAAVAELAEFAREVREAGFAEVQGSIGFNRGRMQLLQLVEQRRDERRRAGAGKFKGAVMSVAAVAGGGLVVAGAASGSNPVTLAVDMAREISGPAMHAPALAPEYSFEAEVVASYEGTLDVMLDGRTIRVEPPASQPQRSSPPEDARAPAYETGTVVRITGREPATDNVAATKIEVVPNGSKPSATALAANPGTRTPTAPAANVTKAPAVIKTATPLVNTGAAAPTRTPTPKPSPTPTPKPVLTSVATVTAVAEPNETAPADPAIPAPLSADANQNAPRVDPKVTAK